MKNRNIKSLDELHQEVNKLKLDCAIRENQLIEDGKNYIKQFSPSNLIKGFFTPQSLKNADEKTNISGNIMSLVLPFLLNKTLFRGSGLITKAISALVSRNVGKKLDADTLLKAFNSVKSWFSKKKKTNNVEFGDYGIPPDSETY